MPQHKIALLETAAPDEPGSMRRYADLIIHAMARVSGGEDIEFVRVPLAPCAAALARWPAKLRSWAHHGGVVRSVRSLSQKQFDLFHIIDGSHGYISRFLPPERTIATSHDIIPLLQSQGRFPVSPPSRGAQWVIRQSLQGLKRCAMIMADSKCSAQDLVEAGVSSDLIRVQPLAIDDSWAEVKADPQLRPGESISNRYIFHVGNNGFYKNRAGVLRVFGQIPDRSVRLKMAGPPPSADLMESARALKIESRVDFLTDPTDDELRALYRNAEMLLFPSYYEGFGWPPLEAMASRCPVVASSGGSLPEVVGEAGLIADADDVESLANHCQLILQSAEVADQLRMKGDIQWRKFSLQSLGSGLINIYRQSLARDRQSRLASGAAHG